MSEIKGRLPWRIGATSFVIPGDVEINVRLLVDKVDDVQILFFESPDASNLPHEIPLNTLKKVAEKHNLTYTVHLPTDVHLGSQDRHVRRAGVDVICRLIEQLDVLSPLCFDLHLLREAGEESKWLGNLDDSLTTLSSRLGQETSRVAVENIDYPFDSVKPLVEGNDFSFCLDVGHAMRYGHDLETMYGVLDKTKHVHVHGVVAGKDHMALSDANRDVLQELGEKLAAASFDGVVTLEMYEQKRLEDSLQYIENLWLKRKKQ